MRLFNKLILCALFMASIQTATAGVSLGATRVIYNEKDKETALEVRNAPDEGAAEKAFLIQSWVSNFDEANKSKTPFVFTPPLFKLASGKSNRLRLTVTDLAALPSDRESIFLINVRAIPST
ncbi:molecular chaperone, partial [Pantoea endophytica]